MNIELTSTTEKEYSMLLSGNITPEMAAEYLKEERITLRNFGEVLKELYQEDDLQNKLVSAFISENPNMSADSVQRRVRNWISGQNQPYCREDIFIIAFALRLSEAQTSRLLGVCTDYGLHYRDGHDAVYGWFLRTERSYREAKDFYNSLPPVPCLTEFPDSYNSHLTREVQNDFLHVQSEKELRDCYIRNLNNFGSFHLRAYSYFQKYLNQLIKPNPAWSEDEEADYSMETVMQLYLSLSMPKGKNLSGYSVTQKLIKKNWPNTTSLKNIYSHKEDVPRKLLLLLYVITENITDDYYESLDEENATLQDRIEDHWWTLNAILTDCGMPLLDPKNATDWLILYAITATDESMSERIEKVIEKLF